MNLYGTDLFGHPIEREGLGPLSKRFEFPPFSVFDARSGDWQDRKRAWIGLGIESEIGRDAKSYNTQGWVDKNGLSGACVNQTGTSIFDPVLCEMCYRWFCPSNGQVVDPFAGGSVRGIVAGLLGFRYWGCDLSAKQIEANEHQKTALADDKPIRWVIGDAMECVPQSPEADFIFACPPYGDLERYSDDPRDLSTMEYHTFIAEYKRIIMRCVAKLKPNRFACFVVGDFRCNKGNFRGFVADTVKAFQENGMQLYNDAILLTPCGSLPIRVGKQFDASRKLGKTHQNVLVFVKGDARQATRVLGG